MKAAGGEAGGRGNVTGHGWMHRGVDCGLSPGTRQLAAQPSFAGPAVWPPALRYQEK